MAANNLKKVLEWEEITEGKLRVHTSLSKRILRAVLNQKRSVAPTIEFKILHAINAMSNREYRVDDIFPKSKRKTLRRKNSDSLFSVGGAGNVHGVF